MTNICLPVFGQLAWIDAILLVWFTLTAISVIYVAYDAFTNNPEMKIMRIGWVLVTLYLGPISLFLYIMSGQEPRPARMRNSSSRCGNKVLVPTIHCVAGDATGIVVAAALTAALGLPMWIDLIVEYAAGFAFGLLVFQALFMKNTMGGSYLKSLRIRPTRMGLDELYDGRDVSGDDHVDDGTGHARDGADPTRLLGRDVRRRRRGVADGVSSQCLARRERSQAWHGQRLARWARAGIACDLAVRSL